jgi:hypothetical protein
MGISDASFLIVYSLQDENLGLVWDVEENLHGYGKSVFLLEMLKEFGKKCH